jgi:hypothetical protein
MPKISKQWGLETFKRQIAMAGFKIPLFDIS